MAAPTAPAMQFPSAPPTRRSSPGNTPIFTIRPRRPEDLAPLAVVLAEQQPRSLYPISWPLPFPVDDFLQRDGELAAFVAEDNRTGETVGHVSVCGCIEPPKDPKEAAELDAVWAAGHGCAVSELRIIGVLFTDPAYAGTGMGSALFNAAIEVARKDGGRPVLDCLRTNTGPLAFYQRRGWKMVGTWHNTIWVPGEELLVDLFILPDDK